MAIETAPTSAAQAPADTGASPAPRVVPGVVERPRLFAALERAATAPVTLVCAPAGSGKTMLLASWLRTARPEAAVAWVQVERDESDATHFWTGVMQALRDSGAVAANDPLATLTPAPGGHEELLRALLGGLERLSRPVLLVLDDLHHLRSEPALAALERLIARPPPLLRTIVASRRDPPLGLHRLRVTGELNEIRAADLDFTAGEAGELMAAAGVDIEPDDLRRLCTRTEGWAAGLRLAAISLARHDDPARFVAEFSGSERTVADYLLGEVLAHRPPEVRELLLRTSILERVNGPLADLLTGRGDGTRILHELEEANAFVVAMDVGRAWFRYHHLLGDLLRLELRRTAPEEVARLHGLAAGWFAEHGHYVEAIRHAQQARDWELVSELLGRHWVQLVLDGEDTTLGALLAGLPEGLAEQDAELTTIAAAARMVESRWAEADALLAAAERALPALPATRRRRAETALGTARLLRARRVGDMEAIVDIADTLRADAPAGEELEALALMNLGIAESWLRRTEAAEAHLEQGLALGRRAGRAYVEVGCLGGLGTVATITQRLDLAEERLRQAIAVAERVGWSRHPIVAPSYLSLAAAMTQRGRLAEAAAAVERADPILAQSPEPAASVGLRHVQGMIAMAQGRFDDALSRFVDGQRIAAGLRATHFVAAILRQWELRARLRLGEVDAVRAAFAQLDPGGQTCSLAAHLCLLDGDPRAAAQAVAPVLDGTQAIFHVNMEIEALLLDALARAAMDDAQAAEASVERALALAEPGGSIWPVLTIPGARELLAAHPMHRTAHAAFLRELLDHLSGVEPEPAAPGELAEPLSERELAVLRFLPTNLSAGEIGSELFLSVHTVKTHMRKLYAKLDAHTRAEAVQRGRALGLLAPARRAG
jgi:LuxR family transcriptional regulator, maltose regulon positive regulatory protein